MGPSTVQYWSMIRSDRKPRSREGAGVAVGRGVHQYRRAVLAVEPEEDAIGVFGLPDRHLLPQARNRSASAGVLGPLRSVPPTVT